MNFRSSELTSGKLFPLHRPSSVVGMPERCSLARIRFAALTRVLASSAPFRQISTCNGRLRREHLSYFGSYQSLTRKMLTAPAFSWKWPTIHSEQPLAKGSAFIVHNPWKLPTPGPLGSEYLQAYPSTDWDVGSIAMDHRALRHHSFTSGSGKEQSAMQQ
jgi:hypothetical protein